MHEAIRSRAHGALATLASWAPVAQLNGPWHRNAMLGFLALTLAHWVEHLSQAYQVYVLDWPASAARGTIGLWWPWLVESEWLHYGYAILMLMGLVVLRFGLSGRARAWWDAALWIQVWHHFEHLLLLVQAISGWHLAGAAAPTSVVQLVVPRVELHLFYNGAVFAPMVLAMWLHARPPAGTDRDACACARHAAPDA